MPEIAGVMMSPDLVMVPPLEFGQPPLPQIVEPVAMGMPQPMTMPEPNLDPGQPAAGTSRPPLLRRRSSLRQGRTSVNGTPKVVSWAMDRDWADHLTKFDHVVYAAEFASLSFFIFPFFS